jgi:hypothetical protein
MGFLLALVVLGAGGVFAGSAASLGVCQVQLRVDVFGGGQHWALHGGLDTGKTATLRAVHSGCAGLDHIAGRRVGGSGALSPHPCAGATCFWRIRSRAMTAIDFQAYARSRSGRLVHSNIVRVAWAGGHENTWTGTWHVAGSGYSGNYVLTETGTTVTGTCNWLGGCRDTGTLSGANMATWTGVSTPNDPSLHPSDFRFTMASDGQSFSGGGTTTTGSSWSETAECTAGACLTNQ